MRFLVRKTEELIISAPSRKALDKILDDGWVVVKEIKDDFE